MKPALGLTRLALGVVLAACATLAAGCRKPADPASSLPGGLPLGAARIEGAVVKGPVRGARVRAYRFRADGSRGALLGETSTDSAGRFELNLIGAAGALRIEATGGAFVDEATRRVLALPEDKAVLCALVAKSDATKPIAVTPLTAMAAAMAIERIKQGTTSGGDFGIEVAAAIEESNRVVAERYGLEDIAGVLPEATILVPGPDTGKSGDTIRISEDGNPVMSPRRYAAVLAELSEEARRLSTEAGQPLNVLDLTAALAADAADGAFDGKRDGRAIAIEGTTVALADAAAAPGPDAELATVPVPVPLPLPSPESSPKPEVDREAEPEPATETGTRLEALQTDLATRAHRLVVCHA